MSVLVCGNVVSVCIRSTQMTAAIFHRGRYNIYIYLILKSVVWNGYLVFTSDSTFRINVYYIIQLEISILARNISLALSGVGLFCIRHRVIPVQYKLQHSELIKHSMRMYNIHTPNNFCKTSCIYYNVVYYFYLFFIKISILLDKYLIE